MLANLVALSLLTILATARPSEGRWSKNGLYRLDTVIPRSDDAMPITKRSAENPLIPRSTIKRQELHGNQRQRVHAVAINLGGREVNLYLDTGSSNIWMIDEAFQCIDQSGNPVDNANCMFVNTGFNPASAAGSRVESSFFNTGYAGGEYMIGYGWKSDASFNGVTVKNQLFGAVTKAYWAGDGYTSGLLGMGSLYTNQIYLNNTISPTPGDDNRIVFPNPFTLAWQQGLSSEYHTLALDRVPLDDEHNGVQPAGSLSLGGVPSGVALTGKQITLPLISWSIGANGAYINEQAWSAPNVLTTFTFPGSDQVAQPATYANMDTGSPSVGLTSAAYKAYTAQITSLACDGSGLPDLAWHVDGIDFPIDKRDLLGYSGSNTCYLDIYDSGDSASALGPNFAQSYVFSWNKATAEVTIMERAKY